MDITEEIKESADRAFELLEIKSPHQLAGELVELQRKHNIALSALNKLQDQRDQLVAQLTDATAQCGVMAELLREVTKVVPAIGVAIDDLPVVDAFLERIEAAIAGKLPVQDAPSLAYVQGAADFKLELLKSTKAFVHPHIEGVFAVFNNRNERGNTPKQEDAQ